jgi:predicted nucleic acid-binding protein
MKTYIIKDSNIIMSLINDNRVNQIVLHIDSKKKIAKYESDYTLYELTLRTNYNKTIELLKQL